VLERHLELRSEPRTPSVCGEPCYISCNVQHLGAGRLHVRRNSGEVTFQNSAAAGQECMKVLGLRHSGSRLGTIRQRVTIENRDSLEKIGEYVRLAFPPCLPQRQLPVFFRFSKFFSATVTSRRGRTNRPHTRPGSGVAADRRGAVVRIRAKRPQLRSGVDTADHGNRTSLMFAIERRGFRRVELA
jgi:hypothetical protein